MARLRGFKRPPRGGEGMPMGLRAHPLRDRRRCAAGGRLLSNTFGVPSDSG
jgi:hypothetical protein